MARKYFPSSQLHEEHIVNVYDLIVVNKSTVHAEGHQSICRTHALRSGSTSAALVLHTFTASAPLLGNVGVEQEGDAEMNYNHPARGEARATRRTRERQRIPEIDR